MPRAPGWAGVEAESEATSQKQNELACAKKIGGERFLSGGSDKPIQAPGTESVNWKHLPWPEGARPAPPGPLGRLFPTLTLEESGGPVSVEEGEAFQAGRNTEEACPYPLCYSSMEFFTLHCSRHITDTRL